MNDIVKVCKKHGKLTESQIYRRKPPRKEIYCKDGTIRGLLCANCNQGLGQFKENTDNLRKAIAYLELHEKKGK